MHRKEHDLCTHSPVEHTEPPAGAGVGDRAQLKMAAVHGCARCARCAHPLTTPFRSRRRSGGEPTALLGTMSRRPLPPKQRGQSVPFESTPAARSRSFGEDKVPTPRTTGGHFVPRWWAAEALAKQHKTVGGQSVHQPKTAETKWAKCPLGQDCRAEGTKCPVCSFSRRGSAAAVPRRRGVDRPAVRGRRGRRLVRRALGRVARAARRPAPRRSASGWAAAVRRG